MPLATPRAYGRTGMSRPADPLVDGLRGAGPERDAALGELHALLLRGAHHELRRRSGLLERVSRDELEDLATQAADDAMTAILAKLDTFRGASRFTTWVYKFALLEAGVKLRKLAWQGREVPLEPEGWQIFAGTGLTPDEEAEQHELVAALKDGIEAALTPHQRRVLVALALNGVPIDVLAERLGTNRNALYKTLHDARQRLRKHLAHQALVFELPEEKR